MRTQKIQGAATTSYILGAGGNTEVVVTGSTALTYNFFAGPENVGQAKRSGGTLTRYYYLKDHIGDIRATLTTTGTVDAYNDYYPYGQLMDGRSQTGSADPRYKYTGKERDVETNYDYFGARYYDCRIGRWLAVDPLAEKYASLSPFNYADNNPIRSIDPDGAGILDIVAGVANGLAKSATPYEGKSIESYGGDKHDYAVGNVIGDVVGMVAGGVEMGAGAGMAGGGSALSLTGLGAPVGIPLAGAGVLVAGVGAVTTGVATANAMADYSNVKDHSSVGEGKKFTQSQKEKFRDANKQANGGELKSDISGETLEEPQQHQKGVKPPENEAHVDHKKPKSKGGSNSSSNAQVISRKENLQKSNN